MASVQCQSNFGGNCRRRLGRARWLLSNFSEREKEAFGTNPTARGAWCDQAVGALADDDDDDEVVMSWRCWLVSIVLGASLEFGRCICMCQGVMRPRLPLLVV